MYASRKEGTREGGRATKLRTGLAERAVALTQYFETPRDVEDRAGVRNVCTADHL